MANYINVTGFSGTANLICGPGTSTDNYLSGTFNFKNINISKQANADAMVSGDFESTTNDVTFNGFADTGTSISSIAGWGGGCEMNGVAIDFEGWSATISVDTENHVTFASPWKTSSICAGQVVGSFSGRLKTTFPVPTTTTQE